MIETAPYKAPHGTERTECRCKAAAYATIIYQLKDFEL